MLLCYSVVVCAAGKSTKLKNKDVFDKCRLGLRDKHFYDKLRNRNENRTSLNQMMIFKALK